MLVNFLSYSNPFQFTSSRFWFLIPYFNSDTDLTVNIRPINRKILKLYLFFLSLYGDGAYLHPKKVLDIFKHTVPLNRNNLSNPTCQSIPILSPASDENLKLDLVKEKVKGSNRVAARLC